MPNFSWIKHGLVVTPDGAPDWRRTHCGMMSVLPWDGGGYRMFLTGRDAQRRYHIGWLALDADLRIVHEPEDNPVLTAGRMGCFDCQGVCMPTVVRLDENQLYMYYVGWGMALPGLFANQLGLAISRDNGRTWSRHSQAPLQMLDEGDPIGVGTVFVLRQETDQWRMWYTTFRNWVPDEQGKWRHYYHIKYAESRDGIHWIKPTNNIAVDFVDETEYAVARPVIIEEAGFYRMWFCTRSTGSTYRIGYAESPDGRTWTRRPSGIEPSAAGWDSQMVEYAYVIKRDVDYLMFYNGNGFGASGTGIATVCDEDIAAMKER